ncbi:MucR family transcriptional regulator [Gluconacetobacter azotocaptans]|uniref:MucR family transcriptional regulator n=1 Tax=Gluconacetobacter azotocaptans TaxID=142834 RepID=A0A7W4JPG3_9PROT|nr:MucR family transcriptional regulator [Gluconacetobacter azotocaptans]MBB2188360.1 MucR family transcriptional regulator [Gluconacetobacter azotocaptans]GBQ32026.1 Ros/MucR family transcriptional regulator [Gluconacetobacter azotocaptans DSM 13594]
MNTQLRRLTARIVSAYVAHTNTPAVALPSLLASIFDTLATLGKTVEAPLPLTPAVPPRKSVFPDYIVCLEDGLQFKTLRRHLRSTYNLTPEQYRARWGLPDDYPMVAPNHSQRRSAIAKQLGLGRKSAAASATVPERIDGIEVTKLPAARRGRPRKS